MVELKQRFLSACRNIYKDVKHGCDSGTNLIGVIDLDNGKVAQLHVAMVTDELEFIDPDGPTGCADDLIVSYQDFEPQPSRG